MEWALGPDRVALNNRPGSRAFERWKPMAKHRTHSLEFKRQVAQEFLAGETLHGLTGPRSLSGRRTPPAAS